MLEPACESKVMSTSLPRRFPNTVLAILKQWGVGGTRHHTGQWDKSGLILMDSSLIQHLRASRDDGTL